MKNIGNLPVHPLANIVPMACPDEQLALELDIQQQGQVDPIVLYRGKIVDGRCRALACLALGVAVRTESLPNNFTITEVTDKVKSLNTRRNLTKSQKAIIAAKQYRVDTSVEQKGIFTSWGVSKPDFAAANYLLTNRPDYADALFEGKKVPMGNGRFSYSVRTVCAFVKIEIQKLRSTLPDIGKTPTFDPSTAIDCPVAWANYNKMIKQIGGNNPTPGKARTYDGSAVRALIAEIAKHYTASGSTP
jgi:hypothetical protein